ncbi:hypothetical protein KR51_00010720 [Rubidibacter lacunae KORDI 51-2]|uniref:Uncharacterized protein n=1 Tax=Rubidibacter lacunae KORDI 51-2 TaxID=582515 RepID=U5DN31_9CHRO|nr:DUF5682 family protein [Rubidibacter lacunae]ERN42262.1 hypothetical protein KR51_00010720 [Rubidibacter lacunae KORDI 51-2]
MSVHYFGIRHHGPGSARSLRQALDALQPDALLVEGPADASAALKLAGDPDLEPPVALLLYAPDGADSVYYPLARFSPEWQALQYAKDAGIPVQLMDLPQAHQCALRRELLETRSTDEDPPDALLGEQLELTAADAPVPPDPQITAALDAWMDLRRDPLSWLAHAAGFGDGERWWEHLVEERQDDADVFAAIQAAMTLLRGEVERQRPSEVDEWMAADPARAWEERREALREAYMRQTIRRTEKGSDRLAVVCGAWHVPALVQPRAVKDDKALLRGLPKTKVEATWIPWTYRRLTLASGYGAGIASPGWYDHLWQHPERTTVRWLVRTARLLRDTDLDASSANIIEAARLADALAALRDRPRPGLDELNAAVQTVLCFGSELPMQLVWDRAIVGDRLGRVPEAAPTVPLQRDLQRLQKRLRLKPDPSAQQKELDLRKPLDLERSQLFHRLRLLAIDWGTLQGTRGTGTFKEVWRLQWQPEFALRAIEAGVWGNTVEAAATACSCDRADRAPDLPSLSALLDRVLLATLPSAIARVLQCLQDAAAVASEIAHLMDALPPLARVARYKDVRQTDAAIVARVVDSLVARICIGLPAACASLDDDAAADMDARMQQVNRAINLLRNDDHRAVWWRTIAQLGCQDNLHGLLAGRCCRMLLDSDRIDRVEAARQLSYALSRGGDPARASAWIEGFLQGSGLLLLHDDTLWHVLDDWVTALPAADFTAMLPLLRRTFSTFAAAERRQMAERVRHGGTTGAIAPDEADASGAAVLPLVAQLLGVTLADVRTDPQHKRSSELPQ